MSVRQRKQELQVGEILELVITASPIYLGTGHDGQVFCNLEQVEGKPQAQSFVGHLDFARFLGWILEGIRGQDCILSP